MIKGFFSSNKKNGLGVNFYINKNFKIVGNFVENNVFGLAIYIKNENNERIFFVENDKSKREITNENEIFKIILKHIIQDEDIIIINDKYPAAKHHILVIPTKHIENAKSLTSEDLNLGNINFKMNFLRGQIQFL